LHAVQPAQDELPESQHALDPAVGWLGNPLAPEAGRLAVVGLQVGRNDRHVQQGDPNH
jgi:hypothetical protein